MKRTMTVLLIVVLLQACLSGCSKTIVISPSKEELNITMPTSTPDNNSPDPFDNLFSFSFKAGSEQISLPVQYKDLVASGWTTTILETEHLLGNIFVTGVEFSKGEYTLSCVLANQTPKLLAAPQTDVVLIQLREDGLGNEATAPFMLPKNITVGKSLAEEIEAAYGKPNDTYESMSVSDATIWLYEYDKNEHIQFVIDNKTQVLKIAALYRAQDPLPYTEVPAEIKNYTIPQAISTELAQEFSLDEIAYKLPIPVSQFLENGWELVQYDEENSSAAADVIPSNYSEQLLLIKDEAYAIPVVVKNYEMEERPASDCYVVDLFLYADYVPTLIVSPNMNFDTTKQEVDAICENYTYCYKEDSGLDIYWIYVSDLGYVSPVFNHETQKIEYFQFLCSI